MLKDEGKRHTKDSRKAEWTVGKLTFMLQFQGKTRSFSQMDLEGVATTNSKLQPIILNYTRTPVLHPKDTLPAKSEVSIFIVDMMAAIRTLTALLCTYEELIWRFVKSLPCGYHRIDIVTDMYQDPPIKSVE